MPEFGTYARATTVEDTARIQADVKGKLERRRSLPTVYENGDDSAAVWLPHDCDEWVIASGSVDEAVAQAEEFRAALDEAIEWLRSQRG